MPSLSVQLPVCLRRKKRKERKEKSNEAQELLGHASEESSGMVRGSTSIIDRTRASERERERERERVLSAASRHVSTESFSEAFPDEAVCILEQRSSDPAYHLVPRSTDLLSIYGSEHGSERGSRSLGSRFKAQRKAFKNRQESSPTPRTCDSETESRPRRRHQAEPRSARERRPRDAAEEAEEEGEEKGREENDDAARSAA